jgi:hypothetical protein
MTMLERYRTLRAAADRAGEFTVGALAEASGVKQKTISTVLRRDKRFFERVGTVATGSPGGQNVLWRVKPSEASRLRDTLAVVEQPASGAIVDATDVPAALLAAEELLLRPVEGVERELELTLAKIGLNTARAMAAEENPPSAVQTHVEAVEFLLALAAAETEAGEEAFEELVRTVDDRWARLASEVSEVDPALFEKLKRRLGESVVAEKLTLPAHVEVVALGPSTPLLERLTDVLQSLALSFRVVSSPSPAATLLEIVVTTGLAEDFVRSILLTSQRPEMIVIDESEDHHLAPEIWSNDAIYLGPVSAERSDALAGAIRVALDAASGSISEASWALSGSWPAAVSAPGPALLRRVAAAAE